uniref:Small ribosomal subunit protein uS9c n=1 Tax=Chloropicon maureeniae TaxID=1461542 RepID=A0A4D6C391_9CHLO|nr:ribosomal protein S9 [Chloropicon maureeniae]QBX98226.1 ribosomal protein S9 [Chloropicon maureeniae]
MDVQNMEHVNNQNFFLGLGRRKRSSARITVLPKPKDSSESTFSCQINGQSFESYFQKDPFSLLKVQAPFKVIQEQDYPFLEVRVNVSGGGLSSQADAIRLALSKALIQMQPNLRQLLRQAGFLTSDARRKERKKYGLKKARKAPQFSKR